MKSYFDRNTLRGNAITQWFFHSFIIASFSAYGGLAWATTEISTLNHALSAQQDMATASITEQTPRVKQVNFEGEYASQNARHIANWVIDSGDNRSMPFVIIDKMDAKVFVFNPDGQLRGAAPALLGLARGDDAVSGIGEQKLSNIAPDERTTPAGRFVAALDRNLYNEEILWVNYDTGISLHQVHTTNLKEQRGQRLSTPTPLDNRISFGCINVPVEFYKKVVSPAFTGTNGVVYVLPEIRSLREVFNLQGGEQSTSAK
ncbi:MAG: hypothetical protein Q7U23_15175 [Methylococcales bacterium]|nr:hypothetical protein [Methylococcales bacterium]